MKIVADMHTHTNVSAHAYSSLDEMVRGARDAGLRAIAITNHGPAMQDGAHQWHFGNMGVIPRVMHGVSVIRGIECNILPPDGALDRMEGWCYNALDYVIASFHEPCFPPVNAAVHTAALENILKNPRVQCFGHLGNPNYPFDQEYIISRCNEYGKIVEINNNSVNARKGSEGNCVEIARLCKKYGVPIMVSSDSHISYKVGGFDNALGVLAAVDFPEELVINADFDRLVEYFRLARKIDITQ